MYQEAYHAGLLPISLLLLRAVIVLGEGEKLLVNPFSLVKVGMQVDLGRLDGGMSQVLLHHAEVLRAAVELAGIAVANFMGGYPVRSVFLEDMLHRPRGDMMALLPEEEGALDTLPDKFVHFIERLPVDEDNPDLAALPPDTNSLVFEIDILDIHAAELRYPHARGIDGADDQAIPAILDGIDQANHLAVLEVAELLVLDLGPLHGRHRVRGDDALAVEKAVERRERGDYAVQGLWLVCPHRADEREVIADGDRGNLHRGVEPCPGKVFPV